MLLTGGSSRRLGQDKALLIVASGEGAETLAARTARVLSSATRPVIEVGRGLTGLPWVPDDRPGAGPLAAVATGATKLVSMDWKGPVVVVATDLPHLSVAFLQWLADHPSDRSVIPVAQGRLQPLCARYEWADLEEAVALAAAGAVAMSELLGSIDPLRVEASSWVAAERDERVLSDVDTPADLARMRGPAWPHRGRPGEAAR